MAVDESSSLAGLVVSTGADTVSTEGYMNTGIWYAVSVVVDDSLIVISDGMNGVLLSQR